MRFSKAFRYALRMVLHSKLRSWLTIIGIVIGVAAVIAIVSLGEGLRQQVNAQLNTLGGDILTLSAGAPRAGGGFGNFQQQGSAAATEEEVVLDRRDVQALKGLSEIKLIDTNIRGSVEIHYLGKQGDVTLNGVDPAVWGQITTETASQGRLLGPADSNVVVIGGRLASRFFDSPVGINQMLTIEDRSFRVVGVLDNEATSIYIPISLAYELLDDKERDVYDSIVIKVKDENELNNSMAAIEEKLMLTRHVTSKNKDFSLSSNKARQEQRAQIVRSMTTFLTAIAAVALLVGAVGIANTMFTSVLERTKEIGIMKAIGATNKDILLIFLLNASLIGFIGGFIGVIFGYILSGYMPSLLGSGGFLTRGGTIVTLNSILMAMGISVLIGTLSGAIPAYQASKLKPVDALRYE